MKEKTIDLKYGKLHVIKTNKFRTIIVKVILKNKFEKENITKDNMLTDYLTMSTKKYDTKKKLALKCDELYSLYFGAHTKRRGNFLITTFSESFLDPKYTEEGMLDESFDLLHELIFNPNVKNASFDENLFNIIKKDLKTEIETIKEDSKIYAITEMIKYLGEGKPYSYHGYGYLEDLEELTPKNLYEFYKEFIKTSDVDIYVVGDVEEEQIEKIVREKLNFKTIKKDKGILNLPEEKPTKKIKEIEVDSTFTQSKLAIGCKFYSLTEFEKRYVLNIYNAILGGGFNSLFMQEIREKSSLAYYINSSINKPDNTMVIQSGISYKNYKKTIKLIKEIMKRMTKVEVSDELLESAKVEYLSVLEEIDDNIEDILEYNYLKDLMDLEELEVRCEKIKSITKKDIMEISKKVYIDTIYLLKGENNEEN